MAIKYHRLTYRDYDSSAMLTALEGSIASAWRAMQQERKDAIRWANSAWGAPYHREMARTFRALLQELLAIRREARES